MATTSPTTITTTTTPRPPPKPFTIRPHRPGDLGMMIHRQALHYASECGWTDGRFEAVLARIAADFLTTSAQDPLRERFWVAETTDTPSSTPRFVGSVMLIRDPTSSPSEKEEEKCWAMLRVLFVEPEMQGSGLGATLIKLCVDTAKEVGGYKGLRLKTGSGRKAARRLYERFGFRLVESVEANEFGKGDGDSEVWELGF